MLMKFTETTASEDYEMDLHDAYNAKIEEQAQAALKKHMLTGLTLIEQALKKPDNQNVIPFPAKGL